MNRSEFQPLPRQDTADAPDCLPVTFAVDVLSRGKHLRRLIRQHWKWLSAASFISLLIAIALGFNLARTDGKNARPALLLFQSNANSAPFSTE